MKRFVMLGSLFFFLPQMDRMDADAGALLCGPLVGWSTNHLLDLAASAQANEFAPLTGCGPCGFERQKPQPPVETLILGIRFKGQPRFVLRRFDGSPGFAQASSV